jgi:hypothetical protein
MRVASVLSVGLCCVAFALPAKAGVMAERLGPIGGQAIVGIAEVCPSGSQWVAAGYGRKGEWQIAHCSTWVSGLPSNYQGGSAGWHLGGYGQPSPTEGMPGSNQPSASSHPADAYMPR